MIKITFVKDAIEKTIKDAKLDFSKLAEALATVERNKSRKGGK